MNFRILEEFNYIEGMKKMEKDNQVVSEKNQEKSYNKYLNVEMANPSEETLKLITLGPINSLKATRIENRNDLFKDGYLETETGYCVLENGTAFVACLTKMPDVTTEMFDWWFAWHGLDSLRYQIWNPEDHFEVETLHREKALDSSLSYKERYWNTTHLVTEDIGLGRDVIQINFKNPADLGYEADKIGTNTCGTIVCANCTSENKLNAVMTHFVREIEGGIELRSRFWIGYQIDENKNPVKVLPERVTIPEFAPKSLINHCAKEFAHLAKILPSLFKEEKLNF
ncbi:phloretin hydrolase [Bacillus sp. AFS076308]|uniref:DAPG hydrolase family protein n=1 Tax=unclassified Bacillus (in: firmicutes) TaxID=185979 RepID=UPI000BF82F61|nr:MULTISPECIES: phloretin hydrolase [unclassified Bacillus (in: firmicutes)]PFO06590.1 phloretin hydrolase [Bacillus sp. AFS076308]PGV52856.1 phloretin hydrolase [Bacillus sp. AFS037270]